MSRYHQSVKAGYPLPDRRPIYEWAADNVDLPGAFTIGGRFNVSISNHFRAPLDALIDHRIRRVCVLAPTRGGKSLIGDVWLPRCVAVDPGPFMVNMQTQPLAEDHAARRTYPILGACKLTAGLMPADSRKVTKGGLIFQHGMPLDIQGPSIGNLQGKGVRYQWDDEVWIWPPGRLAEALARLDDFDRMHSSKAFIASQGGEEGSEWHDIWKESSQAEWMVPCLKCGVYQVPTFTGTRQDRSRFGIVWDNEHARGDDGKPNYTAIAQSIRYVCEVCGHEHVDEARTQAAWNDRGGYEVQNPGHNPTIAGFHWHGVIFRQWAKLAFAFIAAQDALEQGNVDPLRVFTQKDEARFWSDAIAYKPAVDQVAIYDVDKAWPDELIRFLTVDVQSEGVLWFVVRAWAKSGESRRLAFGKIFGWQEVAAQAEKWKVAPNHVAIDSGYDAKVVYRECALRGWVALKGDDAKEFRWPIRQNGRIVGSKMKSYAAPVAGDPEKGTGGQGQRFAALIRWSNPTIKDRLKRLRDGKGAPWLHAGDQGVNASEDDYNEHISSEFKKEFRNKKTGKLERLWFCPSNKPNHLWDCEAEQALMATLADCLSDYEEK